MARGWESKSVEGQVLEFQQKDGDDKKQELSPEQQDLHRRREVLELARARAQHELQSSQSPRRREQLTRALADLDSQLASLPDPAAE